MGCGSMRTAGGLTSGRWTMRDSGRRRCSDCVGAFARRLSRRPTQPPKRLPRTRSTSLAAATGSSAAPATLPRRPQAITLPALQAPPFRRRRGRFRCCRTDRSAAPDAIRRTLLRPLPRQTHPPRAARLRAPRRRVSSAAGHLAFGSASFASRNDEDRDCSGLDAGAGLCHKAAAATSTTEIPAAGKQPAAEPGTAEIETDGRRLRRSSTTRSAQNPQLIDPQLHSLQEFINEGDEISPLGSNCARTSASYVARWPTAC